MKKMIAISLTLLTCSVSANVCQLTKASADKLIRIQGVPGFFFKVHPSGNYLTFIGVDKNTLIDLNTGIEYPTTGHVDPVWSPDGKFLTHPSDDSNKGLEFYNGDQVIANSISGRSDPSANLQTRFYGVYQSVGKTGDNKYRIITDSRGVSFADFESRGQTISQTSSIQSPCQNIQNFKTDLPMLSKDGKYLSIHDSESKSTKIYEFNGTSCRLALDLGFSTGKVSFNSDSSQIAFHVDQFADFETGYFTGVGQDKVKNVVVMNLKKSPAGDLTPSSWGLASRNYRPGDGGYYPDFDAQGNIYFMEDIENNFQIVQVAPTSVQMRPMGEDFFLSERDCTHCSSHKKKNTATDILANMWSEICEKESNIDLRNHLVFVGGIDPQECGKMVEKFWIPSLGISKQDLLKSCPKESKSPLVVNQWDEKREETAQALITNKCLACHRKDREYDKLVWLSVQTGPGVFENEEFEIRKRLGAINLNSFDGAMATKMYSSIYYREMPREPLKDSDRKVLLDYLYKKILEAPEDTTNTYLTVTRYSEENLQKEREKALSLLRNATTETRNATIAEVNCLYGQRGCTEYIDAKKAEWVDDFLTVEEIKNNEMRLRCQTLTAVTPLQCMDWEASLKK